MGHKKVDELDQLLDQVARGQRALETIQDPRLREAIRVALRIHKNAPAAPDQYARMRMRARVLAQLYPRDPSLLDNAWTALEMLATPAPYIVRGVALAAVLVVAGMGATVAAADTLPDDFLYPVKIASEEVRLALAVAPDDRASVELSIAEHRLAEAEKLAAAGRTSDALVASAMYSEHVASAAAALLPDDRSPVARQLESTFAQQRDRALAISNRLSTDASRAAAAEILATIAKPTVAPGLTVAERVAETAAGVAQQLKAVAEHDANAASRVGATAPAANATATTAASPRATETARQTTAGTAAPVPTAQRTDAPRATTAARNTDAPRSTEAPHAATEAQRKASEVLQTVRKAADDAKAAADRAKHHK